MSTETKDLPQNTMLGERVRARRKELGLSLRELGLRSHLTASFLSQVENNRAALSLNSLQRIAVALDVPMFRFLDGVEQASPVIKADERRKVYSQGRNADYDLLTGPGVRSFMSVLIHLQPGTRVIAEQLIPPTEEWMFVLSGHLEVTLSDGTYHLEPNDSISYQGARLRQFKVDGPGQTVVVCCIAPPVL